MLILSAAVYTQANLLFWAFGLMVGGLLVSLVVAWQMLRGVSVKRALPAHGVAGEPMVLRYHVTNRGWLPVFGLIIHETWGRGTRGWRKVGPVAEQPQRLRGQPHGWVLHLGPKQAAQAQATTWPMQRGQLSFERIVLSTSFPFGIVRRVAEYHQPAEVLVYPHLYRIRRRLLYRLSDIDPSGRKRLERSGGSEEFFGLRQYRVGDRLKMIDWKRSAKTGQLVSREMTQPSPPKMMLGLDLTRTGEDEARAKENGPDANPIISRLLGSPRPRGQAGAAGAIESPPTSPPSPRELAISLAASLVCDAYFHGYQIGMVVMGVQASPFPIHHSLPHRTRMLEALSLLDLSRRVTDGEPPPAEPTVLIVPGEGSAGGHNRVVLGTADMMEYVSAVGDTAALLDRRPAPVSRRNEISEEAGTWD